MPTPSSFESRESLRDWLFARYWVFALSILSWVLPLVVYAGGRVDWVALGIFSTSAAAGWVVARWSQEIAVRLHLASVVVFWTWYAAHPEGLPQHLDRGAAAHVLLLLFPILAAVSLDGIVGAGWMGGLATATVLWRFGPHLEAVVGIFLVASAVLIGLAFRRLTFHLQRANARLLRIATHDPVTDLPNRRALDARVAAARAPEGALLFLDLARFKTVNDVFGHAAGDALLRLVGERIQVELHEADGRKDSHFLAHVGGDEFAVLAEGLAVQPARALADRLVACLEEPFELDGRAVHLGCRVGVATWPHEAPRDQTLFSRADRAAARARRRTERVALWDASLDGELDRGIEVELWRAIERREVFPYFQPVCDLATGAMVGVEALARWRHPERGLVGPATFIEVAEVTGQIVQIDRLMLEQVADEIARWQGESLDVWGAANVSARTLDDPGFLGFVEELVRSRPVLRGKLVLEITESAAMRDPERAIELLRAIRELGVQTALDDFGVGHSSLVYLKRLPADHLKLDRMFVSGIGSNDRDEALLELLLHLARQFGMDVIAEGIETKEQLRWLTERGCRFAQGFLLARPAPAEEVRVLRSRVSGVFEVQAEPSESAEAPEPDAPASAPLGDGNPKPSRVGSVP